MKKFYSQVGQDKWVCEHFNFKKNGYFLDLGAYDGIDLSNTYYLEKELEWKGICVEASREIYKTLKNNRTNLCVNKAIFKENTKLRFNAAGMGGRISLLGSEFTEMIDSTTIELLLKENNAPKVIDYISLDIEGNEYDALLGFPFNEYQVGLWTVEHNLHGGGNGLALKNNIFSILTKNGYHRIKENIGTAPQYPMEDWYINKNIKNNEFN